VLAETALVCGWEQIVCLIFWQLDFIVSIVFSLQTFDNPCTESNGQIVTLDSFKTRM